jgi:hypothetical protein
LSSILSNAVAAGGAISSGERVSSVEVRFIIVVL